MPLLEVRHLVKEFPRRRGLFGAASSVRAVDDVSFTIERGETFGLVGESGSGKTTTGRCILRLIEPTSGEVIFDGRNVLGLSRGDMRRARRDMQIVFQDPYSSLNPRMRVGDIVEEPLVIHRLGSKEERRGEVDRALRQAGLDPPDLFLERYPHQLSGGQRQRVAIAASLVLNPDVLVADEPVSMLDVSVRAGVLAILSELRAQGLGILMITHDLSTAARFADRIAVMYLGRIVEEGSADDVVNNPQHPYTRALLSVVPKRDPREQTTPQILRGETPNPVRIPVGCRFHPRCPLVASGEAERLGIEGRCRGEDLGLAPVPGAAPGSAHAAASMSPGSIRKPRSLN
jgi:peptide/nickel transport system ATP-binding protein